ncbi:hypothetical protein FRC01_010925 [Tulasnella sp. 417]|nr:hypothetical protein FRC01_010925 [Tulasnella sp. 417]
MWNEVLRQWFSDSFGWIVSQERYADVSPAFRVAVVVDESGTSIQDGTYDRAVESKLVALAVVKSPLQWTGEGQRDAVKELETAMKALLSESGVSVVWGIAAIGFNWIMLKQEGPLRAEQLTSWSDDVLSLDSWRAMRDLTDTIKRSV